MPRLLSIILFGILLASPGAAAARFEVLGDLSAPGVAARRVVVYLPQAYDLEPARRFPVLYVHDGQSAWRGGYEIDRAIESLAAARRIEPHLVVAIDATAD